MRPHYVEAYPVNAVKDEQLPNEVAGINLSSDELDALVEWLPTVVVRPDLKQDVLPFETEPIPGNVDEHDMYLRQPTRSHGRSFELQGEHYARPWQDEYGNFYSSLTIKGANFSKPGIIKSLTASNSYIAYGLQESSVSRRLLRASRMLRENGVGTEYILRLAEPKRYPWPRQDGTDWVEYLSLPAYKQKVVESYWLSTEEDERSAEQYVEVSRSFESMTFYSSLRAMDTSFRVDDLASSRVRREVFALANKHFITEQKPYDPRNFSDIIRFNTEIIAPNLARNLAKLHSIGLSHRYPTELNVTALGSIVDLDSVHGEPLGIGDEPITAKDIAQDLLVAIEAIYSLDRIVISRDLKTSSVTFISDYIKQMMVLDGYEKVDDTVYVSASKFYPKIAEILVAAQQIIDEKPDNPDPGLLNLSFVNFSELATYVIGKFFPEIPEQLTDTFAEVIKDPLNNELIHLELKKNVRDYIQLLFDDYANELTSDPNFDLAKAMMGRFNEVSSSNIFDWMVSDVIEVIAPQILPSAQSLINEPPFTYMSEDLRQELLKVFAKTSRMQLLRAYSNAADVVEKILPDLEEEFRLQCQLNLSEPLIPGHDTFPGVRTCPNLFLMQTYDVPLSETLDFLTAGHKEVTIKPVDEAEIRDNNFSVTPGYYLEHVISDAFLPSFLFDGGERLEDFRYEIPDSDYVLFVEANDEGQRKFTLVLENDKLVEETTGLSFEAAIQHIRAHKLDQSRLFDIKSIPSKIRDFTPTLSEVAF